MSDDAMTQLLTAAGGTIAGGGASAVAVRFLFASFKEQLTELTRTLKDFVDKSDSRHETTIGELANMKAKADAAHHRIDELARRIDDLEERVGAAERRRR